MGFRCSLIKMLKHFDPKRSTKNIVDQNLEAPRLDPSLNHYTWCPPPPKKKEAERSIFVTWYSKINIFWFHQIKHCLLKRMIPRLFDLVRKYWFYKNFLKHGHSRILFNQRELFTAGMAVHKASSLFVWFARINGFPGNNVIWKSEKPLSLTEMSREWRENWEWYHSFQRTIFYLMK